MIPLAFNFYFYLFRIYKTIIKIMKNNILKQIILVASLSFSEQAFANTTTSHTFQSSATLSSSCTVSATNIDFTIGSGGDRKTGNITTVCSNNLPFVISFNNGLNGNGTTTPKRYLTSNSSSNQDKLYYSLFQNSLQTISLGSVATNWIRGVGTGIIQNIPFYADLSTSYVTPDIYTDTVTITLNY